jgi:hypothetical protein
MDVDLKLVDNRLTGTMLALHRPDRWSHGLVEGGTCAAARYSIDVDLGKRENAGTFTGSWGGKWERKRAITGTIK